MRRASKENGRRLMHLGSSIIPLGYWILGKDTIVPVLGGMTAAILLLELARIYTELGRTLYARILGPVTRPEEERRITGGSYVFVGHLAAAVLFPPAPAVLAMLFMSIGDPVASFIGQRYGRTALGNKTVEGTLACLAVCVLIALPASLPSLVGLAGAAGATLAEALPLRLINDNVAMPVASGAIMTVLVGAGL